MDGDGRSDLIVGVPGRSSNTGEVDLRLTTAPSKTLSQQDAGLGQGVPGDEFGAAVVLADLIFAPRLSKDRAEGQIDA